MILTCIIAALADSPQETGVVAVELDHTLDEESSPAGTTSSPVEDISSPPPAYTHPSNHTYLDEKNSSHISTTHATSFTSVSNTSSTTLDKDGFTDSERLEHRRTLRYLFTLRCLAISRIALRLLAVLISTAAFALITITVILFVKFTHTHNLSSLNSEYPPGKAGNASIHLTPTAFFASCSGVLLLFSVTLNLLCCLSPRFRRITPLSNLAFGLISVIGIAGWLASCLALEHNRDTRVNFWYAVCEVAELYSNGEKNEAVGKRLPETGEQFVGFCRNTSASWKLAVLQVVLEGVTLVNVIVAWVAVKTNVFR